MEKFLTKPDGIHSFLNNKIFLNGIEYNRKDLNKISTETKCLIKSHPFNAQMQTVDITKKINVNGIDCKALCIEAIDGVVVSMILYPYILSPWIAACSINGKIDVYKSPMGTLTDYVYDKSHKITFGPDGSMIYIWYD